jgi:hypothetical protein
VDGHRREGLPQTASCTPLAPPALPVPASSAYDASMYDDEKDQSPEEIPAGTVGGEDEPEAAADDEPGAADFIKAAVKGAKNLKNLEP